MKTRNPISSIKLWAITATATILTAAFQSASADTEIYQKTLLSTTWVLAKSEGQTSSGAGVLVDAEKKLVITNAHVVGTARAAVLFFPEVKDGVPVVERNHYLDNVKKLGVRGRVVCVDRKRDLALIELDRIPEGSVPIALATESVKPGESVESIGNPGTTEALWVYSSGTVRSVYKKAFSTGAGEHDFKVVETQAPINSGDSGGPVVNAQGELIAIAQAISPKARLVTYCVDIAEIRGLLEGPWKPAPLPITDVLTKADLTWKEHTTGHLEVSFEQKDKSTQAVFVSRETEYFERADVRRVWALASTAKQAPATEVMMDLLQQNARTKMGAWTVEKTDQSEYLIIYCVKLDATASPDAVKSTMEYVAQLTSVSKKTLQPKQDGQTASQTLDAWLAK